MKKILQSDLISIAHRILKLKDHSQVSDLLKETELLYRKLTLLHFYEENKFRLDATITEEKLLNLANNQEKDVEEVISNVQDNFTTDNNKIKVDEVVKPIEISVLNENENAEIDDDNKIGSETVDDVNDVVEFTPSIQETTKSIDAIEEEIEEITLKDPIEDAKEAIERVTLEIDPVFSVPHHELFNGNSSEDKTEKELYQTPQHFVSNSKTDKSAEIYHQAPLSKSINDAFANKISIALNDRIAFEKNLFNGNGNDLNRVISQLNTIESYQEAKDFIDDMVKPEFNYWKGKEDYEARFMELVEKRFL